MKRRILSGLLFCLVFAGCAHRSAGIEPDVPASAPPLTGTWTPQSAEISGQDYPVANFNGASLRLTSQTYEFGGDKGTYDVVSLAPPARMDIHGVEGPNAGRLIPAVFEIDGDRLTICYQLGTGVRPRDFSSPPGTKILLVHYRLAH